MGNGEQMCTLMNLGMAEDPASSGVSDSGERPEGTCFDGLLPSAAALQGLCAGSRPAADVTYTRKSKDSRGGLENTGTVTQLLAFLFLVIIMKTVRWYFQQRVEKNRVEKLLRPSAGEPAAAAATSANRLQAAGQLTPTEAAARAADLRQRKQQQQAQQQQSGGTNAASQTSGPGQGKKDS